jgi:hypothetical protein
VVTGIVGAAWTWSLLLAVELVPADAVPRADGVASESEAPPPLPAAPAGIPNARATFVPPSLGVAVTVAELPAASVVAVAVIVGVAPVAPAAPAGMPKARDRLAPLLLEVPTTVAELPAARVETLPTVIVVDGGPCGPVGPVPPGAAAADAATLTVAFLVTAAEIVSPLVATTDGPLLPLTVTVTLTVPSP